MDYRVEGRKDLFAFARKRPAVTAVVAVLLIVLAYLGHLYLYHS